MGSRASFSGHSHSPTECCSATQPASPVTFPGPFASTRTKKLTSSKTKEVVDGGLSERTAVPTFQQNHSGLAAATEARWPTRNQHLQRRAATDCRRIAHHTVADPTKTCNGIPTLPCTGWSYRPLRFRCNAPRPRRTLSAVNVLSEECWRCNVNAHLAVDQHSRSSVSPNGHWVHVLCHGCARASWLLFRIFFVWP